MCFLRVVLISSLSTGETAAERSAPAQQRHRAHAGSPIRVGCTETSGLCFQTFNRKLALIPVPFPSLGRLNLLLSPIYWEEHKFTSKTTPVPQQLRAHQGLHGHTTQPGSGALAGLWELPESKGSFPRVRAALQVGSSLGFGKHTHTQAANTHTPTHPQQAGRAGRGAGSGRPGSGAQRGSGTEGMRAGQGPSRGPGEGRRRGRAAKGPGLALVLGPTEREWKRNLKQHLKRKKPAVLPGRGRGGAGSPGVSHSIPIPDPCPHPWPFPRPHPWPLLPVLSRPQPCPCPVAIPDPFPIPISDPILVPIPDPCSHPHPCPCPSPPGAGSLAQRPGPPRSPGNDGPITVKPKLSLFNSCAPAHPRQRRVESFMVTRGCLDLRKFSPLYKLQWHFLILPIIVRVASLLITVSHCAALASGPAVQYMDWRLAQSC